MDACICPHMRRRSDTHTTRTCDNTHERTQVHARMHAHTCGTHGTHACTHLWHGCMHTPVARTDACTHLWQPPGKWQPGAAPQASILRLPSPAHPPSALPSCTPGRAHVQASTCAHMRMRGRPYTCGGSNIGSMLPLNVASMLAPMLALNVCAA